jgi:hypothetical protein
MEEHMAYIVFSEGRPFTFKDFLHFIVDGTEHRMTHGTFRNKIREFKKKGVVELDFYSNTAFYTLKGHRFGKIMTPTHTVVHSNPVYRMLLDLPTEKQSIHDIRLRFEVPGIWNRMVLVPGFNIIKNSEDIAIPPWKIDDTIVRVVFHKTDTVSVIIGCSLQPISLDGGGVIRFFNILVRVEERLQGILQNHPQLSSKKHDSIPDYKEWVVTMWHFGRDASVEYTGQKFNITIQNLESIVTRLYVKDFGSKNKIRFERQEYPKKTVIDAIEEKLGNI